MPFRTSSYLVILAGSVLPLWLYSEQSHTTQEQKTKEVVAPVVQRINATEMIKLLRENLDRGKENQNIAVEIKQSKPLSATISEKILKIPKDSSDSTLLSTPASNSQKLFSTTSSDSTCDPSQQECVFVYKQTNVAEAKKVVEEAAQMNPKLLQKEIEKLKSNVSALKTETTLVPDTVKPKEEVSDALYVDKSFSSNLRDLMRAVREVNRSGNNESPAEENTNKNLEDNKERQNRGLTADQQNASPETASSEIQTANTNQYLNYAREAIQLEQNINQSTNDHALIQDLSISSLKTTLPETFNTIKKYDANNVTASQYVSVLKNLSEMEDFQKLLLTKFGDKAVNQFNASTIAADLSDEKNISKAKLSLIADTFEESTGLAGPDSSNAPTSSDNEASLSTQNSNPKKNNPTVIFKKPSSKSNEQVVKAASSVSNENDIQWVALAKELSSREMLKVLKTTNSDLAESLRLGRIELDKLIEDLRNLYSLGLLNMIDNHTRYKVKNEYSFSLDRTTSTLRTVSKTTGTNNQEKIELLNNVRIKKNAGEMLSKISANKSLHFVANELMSFTLKNPLQKLWRDLYLDEFRSLRSEAGLMQLLLRLENINESSLGILVNYTFDQLKKQKDDSRGKNMVETLKDANTRNKASTTNDNPF